MTTLQHVLLLGLVLLGASAVPFVPTGEIVSGAAALAAHSLPLAAAVFLVAWTCSCVGDTVLLTAARVLAQPLSRRRSRRTAGAKIERAQAWLLKSPFTAVVTARLVPGMRAPVVIALGLAGVPRRLFLKADLTGCGLWAALYTVVGTLGGRLTSQPLVAVAAAVLLAVTASFLGGLVMRRRQAKKAAGRAPDRGAGPLPHTEELPAARSCGDRSAQSRP